MKNYEQVARDKKMMNYNNKRGTVLMIALWSLAILSIFAVSLGFGARMKITFVSRLNARHQLRYMGEGRIERDIVYLADKGKNASYDTLVDFVSNPRITDEERRINFNTSKYNVISNLIRRAANIDKKEADDLAAAIVDWRDVDDAAFICELHLY